LQCGHIGILFHRFCSNNSLQDFSSCINLFRSQDVFNSRTIYLPFLEWRGNTEMRVFSSWIFVLYYSINIIKVYNILKFKYLKVLTNFSDVELFTTKPYNDELQTRNKA